MNTYNIRARRFLEGWVMIFVPVLLIMVGYYMYWPPEEHEVHHKNKKSAVEITIDHPPKDFFDRRAQLMLGFGMGIGSILIGTAKVIRAFKN